MQKLIDHKLASFGSRFQIDLAYFVKGGLWLTLSLAVSLLLGLARTVFFARLTGQELYGQFGFVTHVIGLFSILALPGMGTALAQTVARGNHGALIDAARSRVKWGALASLLLAGFALYYFYLGETLFVAAFLMGGAFLPFRLAAQVVLGYYNGCKRFDKVSLLSVGVSVLNTLSILLVLWLQQGLLWLIFANGGSQLLLYGAFYLRESRRVQDRSRDPEVVRYGRSLTWAQAIISVTAYVDVVILGFAVSFADVAIYRIAAVLPNSLKSSMQIFRPLVLPKIAEQPKKRFYTKRNHRRLLFLFMLNISVVLVSIAILPTLISTLYGGRYANSVFYAQVLMVSLGIAIPNVVLNASLQAQKQFRTIYRLSLLYGILRISTLIVLVPFWGVWGAVSSCVVARLGTGISRWYCVAKNA